MKKTILYSMLCLLAVACTVQEPDTQPIVETPVEDVFYASLDSQSAPETRVFIDEDIKMHWDADDKLSIFNKSTLNHPYQFAGETGDVAGYFTSVSEPAGTGNDLDLIYAVYPYQESMTISDEGVLTLTLPAEQAYLDGTFDPDANTMVSTTDGNILKFKNVGGYLVLKFYGAGISVKSIRLDGHDGEKLSGEATVTASVNGNPVIAMTSTEGTSITLTREEPIELGGSDNPTVFWMVVPPTHFTKGFRLTLTDTAGNVFIKDTSKDLTITRNSVLRIAPIQVAMNSSGISLDDVSVINKKFKVTDIDEANRTFTVTMPTVTDFSNLVFDFEFSGESLIADGKDIVPGETPIDASHDVTITVRSGNQGKNYTLKAQNTGLPVVRITTVGFDREDIESDPVHKTVWRPADDDNPDLVNATIKIEWPDGTINIEVGTQIKGRGNATWGYPKRPYALKLSSKQKLLGMGNKKHKRWILLANWKDRTLLRNDAAFWLSRHSGLPYTVDGQFVELEFNGEHRGNYYLCEQIKIDKGNRVDITSMAKSETGASDPLAITGGYLMEIDNNWDDLNSFWSGQYPADPADSTRLTDIGGFNFKYQFKDPDEGDRSKEAYYYMTKYIAELEEMIKKIPNGNMQYRTYFDTESAIRFMIVNELTGNGDFYNENYSSEYKGPHSTYLYKDRDVLNDDGSTTVSKLHMGPVWDFDYLSFMPSRSQKWAGADQKNYYFNYMYADADFRSEMTTIWTETKNDFVGLSNYIDQMADYIRLSEEFDAEMWWKGTGDQTQNGEHNYTGFQQSVDKMKQGFTEKWQFIDDNIGSLKYKRY